MTCSECFHRTQHDYSGLFNIACPQCRTAMAMSEPCKIIRKDMVERMDKWGPTDDWQAEPHCNCVGKCTRLENIRKYEQLALQKAARKYS